MIYDVIDSIWFEKIGIVKVQTKYNGIKFYIGSGKGLNQLADEQYIAKSGYPLSEKMLLQFLKLKE